MWEDFTNVSLISSLQAFDLSWVQAIPIFFRVSEREETCPKGQVRSQKWQIEGSKPGSFIPDPAFLTTCDVNTNLLNKISAEQSQLWMKIFMGHDQVIFIPGMWI